VDVIVYTVGLQKSTTGHAADLCSIVVGGGGVPKITAAAARPARLGGLVKPMIC